MTNRAMSDEELASITRDVVARFRASIEHSPAERAEFFAGTTVRLLYEVRRLRDAPALETKIVTGSEDVPSRDASSQSKARLET